MASTTKATKRKHKIWLEVSDPIPTVEDYYAHNILDEIQTALERINLKVEKLDVTTLEVEDEA